MHFFKNKDDRFEDFSQKLVALKYLRFYRIYCELYERTVKGVFFTSVKAKDLKQFISDPDLLSV
jgi:hypothetical protein